MTRIVVEDLRFRYPGAASDALESLHLEIASGEAHALLGASGAGKTTLLNLLSGLLRPTCGRILFAGKDVSNVAPKARNIAQVFQFPVLYDGMDVAGNLAFPMRNFGFSQAEIKARVAYMADELGLGDTLQHQAGKLSMFEKQLVSVGKALMRPNVEVVLLDEPLTAVEPQRKWQLRQSLKRVQADLGVTMIYVTHDQTEALTFADTVSLLALDGVLQTASPEEIYNRPSHEFVGSFVGSPAMDFVEVDALKRIPQGVSAGQRLGLRPEWVELCSPQDGLISGTCSALAPRGTANGEPIGLVRIETAAGGVNVAAAGIVAAGSQLGVRVKRCTVFDEGALVTTLEF